MFDKKINTKAVKDFIKSNISWPNKLHNGALVTPTADQSVTLAFPCRTPAPCGSPGRRRCGNSNSDDSDNTKYMAGLDVYVMGPFPPSHNILQNYTPHYLALMPKYLIDMIKSIVFSVSSIALLLFNTI